MKSRLPFFRCAVATVAVCLACAALSAQQFAEDDNALHSHVNATLRLDGANISSVSGFPFSAKVILQSARTLEDGSTLNRSTYENIARDSRGRTHNEMRSWIDATNSEPKLSYIMLYDPQIRLRTFIYPETHLVRQFAINALNHPLPTPLGPLAPVAESEDLGEEVRDGLTLRGTRERLSYPPGSIGNDSTLVVTTEYWFSTQFRINFTVKREDPRFGAQTLQLTAFRSDEPDPSLFEIPAGYTLSDDLAADATASAKNTPRSSVPKRLDVSSSIQTAKLLTRVQPQYPEDARKNGIEGIVKLRAILDRDGSVQQIRVISGNSSLAKAAAEAVQLWRYQPTLLNGEPVEVETAIQITFMLKTQVAAAAPR